VEEEKNRFAILEEKIGHLLARYQDLIKEKEALTVQIEAEREKRIQLEKRLEMLSQDRETIKTRIDQLLYRLRNVDL